MKVLNFGLAVRYLSAMFLKQRGFKVRLVYGLGLIVSCVMLLAQVTAVKAESYFLPYIVSNGHVSAIAAGCIMPDYGCTPDETNDKLNTLYEDGSATVHTDNGSTLGVCLMPNLGCSKDSTFYVEFFEDGSFRVSIK